MRDSPDQPARGHPNRHAIPQDAVGRPAEVAEPRRIAAAWTVALLTGFLSITAQGADKSGVGPNTISVPKGPGSIEGLGESFQPTLNTGTAKYGLGLKLPPGTAGQQPGLSLSYDGGGANGPLGYGWQLPLPCLQRRTDEGIPTYGADVGFPRSDVFLNESKEELVPRADGFWFSKNEGAFIRYRQVGDHWEGTLPDGTQLEFGLSPEGRIEDAATSRVFGWLLERETDTRGNVIEYVHRSFPGSQNLNQKYLAAIRYGPGAPPWTHFHFATFEYEDRPDWFEDGRAGFLVRTGKRLKSIAIGSQGVALAGHLAGDFDGDGTTDYLNRRYDLGYLQYAGTHSHWSLLETVTLVGADGVTALPAARFGYAVSDPPAEVSAQNHILGSLDEPAAVMDNALVDLVDLNADGLPDVLRTEQGGGAHTVWVNRGPVQTPGGGAIQWGPPAAVDPGTGTAWNFELGSERTHLADMDGDGLADLVHKTADESVFYFANRGKLAWGERQDMALAQSAPPAPFGAGAVRTADVDFDKRIDVIQSLEVGGGIAYRIWFNLGQQAYSAPVTVEPEGGFGFDVPGVQIADCNGDRVPDVARVQPGGVMAAAGLGYGRFAPPQSLGLPDATLDDTQVAQAKLTDLNGDGLADLVLERAAPGTCWYWLNQGNYTFSSRKAITGLPASFSATAAVRWADLNGNGTTDLVYADSQSTPRLQTVELGELVSGGLTPNVLTRIENGIGRVTRLEYAPSTRFALEDAAAGHPWPDPLPFPVTVVAGVTVSDSLGHEYVSRFEYHDGYYDPAEKQFRGFARVEQIEVGDATAPTLVSRSHFDTGREFESMKGRRLRLTAEQEDGQVFTDETTDWSRPPRTLMTGTNGEAVTYAHPVGTVRQIVERGAGEPRRLETQSQYDDYGNPTRLANYGIVEGTNRAAFDDERVTTTEYAVNTNAWILRLASRQEIADENGEVISRTEYYYDDETFSGLNLGEVTRGDLTLTRGWIDPAQPPAYLNLTRSKYDAYGNPITLLDPLAVAPGGVVDVARGHVRQIGYDDQFHTYPVQESLEVGRGNSALVFQAGYDRGFGVVTSAVDFNQNLTRYGYDGFGRLIQVIKPGDTTDYPTTEYDYGLAVPFGAGGLVNFVETRLLDTAPGSAGLNPRDHYLISRTYADGLGRTLLGKQEAEPAPGTTLPRVVVTGTVVFNARQKPGRMLNPCFTLQPGTDLDDLLRYESVEDPAWKGAFQANGEPMDLNLASAHQSSMSYDATLRTTQTTNPDGKFSRTVYEPLVTRIFDENDNDPASPGSDTPSVRTSDGLGRLIRVDEILRMNDDGTPSLDPTTWTTSFQYDLNDQLTRITDAQANVKSMAFDGLKRRTQVNDPDRGRMRFTYDDASNVKATMDAKGQQITYTYDGVNRILTEDYHDEGQPFSANFFYDPSAPVTRTNRPDVAYLYDTPLPDLPLGDGTTATAANTLGNLAYVWDLSGEQHTSYDARGRVQWTVKRIPDPSPGFPRPSSLELVSYRTEFAYDSLDRLTRMLYPDNDQVSYEYNARSLLVRIVGGPSGSILSNLVYCPSGQRQRMDHGNGVRTTYGYDSRQRLTSLLTVSQPATLNLELVNFAYTFDGVSNIESITDRRDPSAVSALDPRRNSQTFAYDDLYRLTRVQYNLPNPPATNGGEIRYRYDRIGNLLAQDSNMAQTGNDPSVTDLGTMGYGGTAGSSNRLGREATDPPGPHALTEIRSPQPATRNYGYDANGNMTHLDGLACTWDFKDRLVAAEDAGMRAEYTYDYTDRRILKAVADKTGATNLGAPVVTLYVGPSFEVREHDQPTKYVLDGTTRVAALTGSLSSNVRIQRLRLDPGWNLLALAVTATNALQQLNSLSPPEGDVVSAAYEWNAAAGGYLPLADGQTVSAGAILWVKATTRANVSIVGSYTEPESRQVQAGGTYLPGTGLEAWSPSFPPAFSAWQYDAQAGHWRTQLTGDLAFLSDAAPSLAPGQAVYVRADAPADLEIPARALRIRYYHQDHLGSSSVVTDADGALIEETGFYPFGAPRNEFQPRRVHDPYQFTQKERDPESRLIYFGKRFYQPALARWLSTDPMEEQGGGLNPYAYVRQNPLKLVDPDGGEITVTPTFKGSGKTAKITHYEIHVTAVLINLSPILKNAGYDKAKVQAFADQLKATIEKSYSHEKDPSRKKSEVTWHTTVDLKVIDDVSQITQGDHVFRLVDKTYDGSRGLSTRGGLWMEIQASTLLKPRPAKEGSEKDYLSPESTGAHELGHTGGLSHWTENSGNLMQEGTKREFDNKTITQKQIETIYTESKAGKLNQGSSKIGSWEYFHGRR